MVFQTYFTKVLSYDLFVGIGDTTVTLIMTNPNTMSKFSRSIVVANDFLRLSDFVVPPSPASLDYLTLPPLPGIVSAQRQIGPEAKKV